ncbi:TRAP transporter substrate-binding protein DctP [Roseovarius sp. CAU 1744]|uniref:TRAP transporter substrate-binding protein DctP n=1 Tax=Roseovarius sp. CAU 1744 TaxID=3140368 RepID=UPI00325C04E5
MNKTLGKWVTAIWFGAAAAGGGQAAEYKMLSSFPHSFVFTEEIAQRFVADLTEASEGEITVDIIGPEAVPPFEGLEPVQAGLYDFIFTHGAYHAGTTGVGLAIDGVASDPDKRRASGVIDFISDHYETIGLKLIAAPTTGTKGLRFYLRHALSRETPLEGMKVRGTENYHPMIRTLGGSPVMISGGEIYTALQKGLIDGAAWPTLGAKGFKWFEVAPYYSEPNFGQTGVLILMNLDAWTAMSDADRALVSRIGEELEQSTIVGMDALTLKETEELRALGMKPTRISEANAALLDRLYAQGVWQKAIEKSGEHAVTLREIAREAGLTY